MTGDPLKAGHATRPPATPDVHPSQRRAGARPYRIDRLDVERFARERATLGGSFSFAELPRLRDATLPTLAHQAPAVLHWSLEGDRRSRRGGAEELWLHLSGHFEPQLTCQRCLEPVLMPLELRRSFRFVATEDEAAVLDEHAEEDILVLHRAFNAQTLIEDEALLALPLVPRHLQCPSPLAGWHAIADGNPASPGT